MGAKLRLSDAASVVANERSTCQAKAKLQDRIKNDPIILARTVVPSDTTPAGQRKLKIRSSLLQKEVGGNVEGSDLFDALDVIRTLNCEEIDETYLKGLLLEIFNRQFAKGAAGVNDKIRRAVCYVDFCLFGPKVKAEA